MLAINIQDLHYQIGSHPILNGVNLQVESGSLYCLVGPSGSGKTTLLKILAGLIEGHTGSVKLEGKNLNEKTDTARATAMVFQNYALFPHLTVWENVALDLSDSGLSPIEVKERAYHALHSVDAKSWALRRPSELSGGQQQRIALARALMSNPKLLLLDEPFSNLDTAGRIELRDRLRKLVQERSMTIVCVLHDQKDAFAMADQLGVMCDGKIIQSGNPLDVYRRPLNSWIATFLGSANLIKGKLVHQAAGEFIAHTDFGELHGALSDIDHPPVVGQSFTLCIRPECLHLDLMPPEENSFEGSVTDTLFQGDFSLHDFSTVQGLVLKISEINPRQRVGSKSTVYAWVEPEDVVGLID